MPDTLEMGHLKLYSHLDGPPLAVIWGDMMRLAINNSNAPSGLLGLRSILVAAVLMIGPTTYAFGAEIVPIAKEKFELTTFDDKPGLRVIVSQPMTIKLGGAFGLMGYRWELASGTYKDFDVARIAGREVAILPVKWLLFGKPPRGGFNSGGEVGACYTPDGNFIAIDVNSGDILQRGLLRNRISKACGGGYGLDWLYTATSIIDAGDVKIVWGQDLVNGDRRQAERNDRREGLSQLAEAYGDNASRAAKAKIGARICRVESNIQYVGFTEGVSPDNGKLQIRVSDAHFKGSSNSRPGGFQPSIIWSSPDDWDLCE